MTRGLFITGTDTAIGKTFVTCLAAQEARRQGYRVGVYKPVCSGGTRKPNGELEWDDVHALEEAVDFAFPSERICPQRFEAPLAPHLAAKREGGAVDAQLLRDGARWWQERVDLLFIEGVGGLLCPLTDAESVADLAAELGFPLLIVARRGLGTINHTLLTVDAAERRSLRIAGIVLNEAVPSLDDPAAELNEREITARCRVPVLGELHYSATEIVHQGNVVQIDWGELAGEMSSDG